MPRPLLLAALAAVLAAPLAAQAPADTLVPAGAEYQFHGAFGGFKDWLYGSRYRALWATPVAAPLAPLAPPPVPVSANPQDTALHLDGFWLWTPDGTAWVYRPLDRDLLSSTTPLARRTLLPTIIQGFNPARHPGAPPVVAVLASAVGAGVPAAGLARIGFDLPIPDGNGRLGYLEEAPVAGPTTGQLLDTLRLDGARRLDTRAYLRERLLDIYLGNWDDVPEEWRWEETAAGTWAPAPRVRDKAFALFDGVLAGWVRNTVPGFVSWGPDYDADLGLMPFQRTLDRQLLAPLDWVVWDSMAAAMQRALPDSVLEAAAATLPAEYRAAAAPLVAALRARREALPRAARRLYQQVNQEGALFGSPGPDTVTVTRLRDGGMTIRFQGGLSRTWGPGETDAVELYLLGGADHLELRGPGREGPRLDVAWEPGLTVEGERQSGLLTTVYGGAPRFPHLGLEYIPDTLAAPEAADLDPTRPPPVPLHGTEVSPVVWFDVNSDVGILIGGGAALTTYRLGHEPFYRKAVLRSGYATATDNYAIEFHAEFNRWRSPVMMTVDAGLSEIAVLHFFGYGNETPFLGPASFYLAQQRQLYLYPAWNYKIGPKSKLAIGPSFKHVRTDTLTQSFINETRPYGTPEFAQAGVLASAVYDTRDTDRFTRHGVRITAGGSFYPFLFGEGTPFGGMSASIASYLTPRQIPELTLATRLTGRLVMGDPPVHEAAFAGGSNSIRGYESNRYAGQAAMYFNGELRLQAGTLPFVVPWQFGVVGIGDVGRVFVDDETSGAWHGAAGGGLWIAMPDRSLGAVFTMVHSPQGTALWLSYQFMY